MLNENIILFIDIKELKKEKLARVELHNWLLAVQESNLSKFNAYTTTFCN